VIKSKDLLITDLLNKLQGGKQKHADVRDADDEEEHALQKQKMEQQRWRQEQQEQHDLILSKDREIEELYEKIRVICDVWCGVCGVCGV
jgi:hypothetical protein